MNSFKDAAISIKNGTKNKSKLPPSVAPPIPSAFPKRQNNFAPPPTRRVSTNESIPTRSPEPELEPEEDGEWAEALYEYNSGVRTDFAACNFNRTLLTCRNDCRKQVISLWRRINDSRLFRGILTIGGLFHG